MGVRLPRGSRWLSRRQMGADRAYTSCPFHHDISGRGNLPLMYFRQVSSRVGSARHARGSLHAGEGNDCEPPDRGQSNRTANLMTLFGSSAIHRHTSGASSRGTMGWMIPGAVRIPLRIKLTNASLARSCVQRG